MCADRSRPSLAAEDDLTRPVSVDLAGLVEQASQGRFESPVLPPAIAADLERLLPGKLPRAGAPLAEALQSLLHVSQKFARKNAHPGMFGYVCSPGLPTDVPAHAVVAALNQNVTGFSSAPGASTVERVLLRWLVELMGMAPGADGLLLSGGSLANYTGLACSMFAGLGEDWAVHGLASVEEAPTMHISATAHFSIERAAILLGVGRRYLRSATLDGHRRIDPTALDEALARDHDDGLRPVCVVASAGATTLGTIDPLDEIADVCARHGVWMHVDGAYGAAAMLSDALRPRLDGLARADSLSFDLHKWMYVGFDGSALLVKNPNVARQVFFMHADYVNIPIDPPPEQHAFFHLGPETSRRFRALAPALALMHYGADRIGRNVEHQVRLASYLAAHVHDHPDLELVEEPGLSVCCFRFAPAGMTPARIDSVNAAIREQLNANGDFYLSDTAVDGLRVLRVCILSPATRAEHIERLIDEVLNLGSRLGSPG